MYFANNSVTNGWSVNLSVSSLLPNIHVHVYLRHCLAQCQSTTSSIPISNSLSFCLFYTQNSWQSTILRGKVAPLFPEKYIRLISRAYDQGEETLVIKFHYAVLPKHSVWNANGPLPGNHVCQMECFMKKDVTDFCAWRMDVSLLL